MSRPLAVSILWAIVFLPLNLQGQDRRTAYAFVPSPVNIMGMGRVAGIMPGGVLSQPGWFGARYYNVPLPAPLGGAPYSLPPAGVFSPFLYGSMYDALPLYTTQSSVSVQTIRSPESKRTTELRNEIEKLARQIQRIQEEQERLRQSLQPKPEPPEQSAEPTNLPVILAFRDGHQMEVQGYAVVDDTFWAVSEQKSMKFSLSDLDLEATQKINVARGVRSPAPQKQ
jgi:hypothetical protein